MPNSLENNNVTPDGGNQTYAEIPAANNEVHRVALKLPTFWEKAPELYFVSIKAQFCLTNITQDTTKYYAVIAALNSEVLTHISDIVLNPPPTEKYEKLKTRLINEFRGSEQKRLKSLLLEMCLGDDKPSHLLRKMRQLAGTGLGNDMLKALWQSRLPVQAQAILSVSDKTDTDLDTLASIADKILEISLPTSDCYAVRKHDEVDDLKRQIAELTEQMKTMTNTSQNAQRPRFRSNSRNRFDSRPRDNSREDRYPTHRARYPSRDRNSYNRSRRFSPSQQNPDFCWYHNKFGEEAVNCQEPCSFNNLNYRGDQ